MVGTKQLLAAIHAAERDQMKRFYEYETLNAQELLLEVYRLNVTLASVHVMHAVSSDAAKIHQDDMDHWMDKRVTLQKQIMASEDGQVYVQGYIDEARPENINA